MRHLKYVHELHQEQGQMIQNGHDVDAQPVTGIETMPLDTVIVAPEHHGQLVEVPEEGAQSAQPLDAKHHLITLEC